MHQLYYYNYYIFNIAINMLATSRQYYEFSYYNCVLQSVSGMFSSLECNCARKFIILKTSMRLDDIQYKSFFMRKECCIYKPWIYFQNRNSSKRNCSLAVITNLNITLYSLSRFYMNSYVLFIFEFLLKRLFKTK